MRFAREKKHGVDWLFTMTLFILFALAALTVVAIGARVYRSTADNMNDTYTSRTALAYVTEKIRQADTMGAVRVGKIGASPALILHQESGGQGYSTYIYWHDNTLKELFARDSLEALPGDGQDIMELAGFETEWIEEGLLRLSVTDTDGERQQVLISLHSGG